MAIKREADKIASMKAAPSKKEMRRRIWTKHSPFKTREAIRQHLLLEINPHNTCVLELMDRKEPPKHSEGLKLEAYHTTIKIHHIIPCSAGGKERFYNEVRLTLYEHWEVHLLRFEAYGQFADVYIFNSCWNKLPPEFKARLHANPHACHFLQKVMADS